MVEAIAVVGLIWVGVVACFMWGDIVKGIRSKKMSGYSMHSATAANISSGAIILGGTTTTSVTVNSPMQTTKSLWVEDIDVGETLKLLTFFLQSRHPEIFEEYKAIRKIEQS